MQLLAVDALMLADHKADLHFIFDEQNVFEARALQTFRETISLGQLANNLKTDKIKSVSFKPSFDEIGLQLADMHVYAWNRYITHKGPVDDGIRQILDKLEPFQYGEGIGVMTKEYIELVLSKLPGETRAKLQAD